MEIGNLACFCRHNNVKFSIEADEDEIITMSMSCGNNYVEARVFNSSNEEKVYTKAIQHLAKELFNNGKA